MCFYRSTSLTLPRVCKNVLRNLRGPDSGPLIDSIEGATPCTPESGLRLLRMPSTDPHVEPLRCSTCLLLTIRPSHFSKAELGATSSHNMFAHESHIFRGPLSTVRPSHFSKALCHTCQRDCAEHSVFSTPSLTEPRSKASVVAHMSRIRSLSQSLFFGSAPNTRLSLTILSSNSKASDAAHVCVHLAFT